MKYAKFSMSRIGSAANVLRFPSNRVIGAVLAVAGAALIASSAAAQCDTYTVAAGPATFIAGDTPAGIVGDDVTGTVTLPFDITVYGTTYFAGSSIGVGSNGFISLDSLNPGLGNVCLPRGAAAASYGPVLYPHWDDLRSDGLAGGIFTGVSGTAPDRTFVVEWQAVYYAANTTALNFEVQFHESSPIIDFVYNDIPNTGVSATVGVEFQNSGPSTQWSCNTAGSVSAGTSLRFTCGALLPGACCATDGSCTLVVQTACISPSAWNGGSACEPNPCPQPPANDECANAIVLAPGGSVTGTNITASGTDITTCAFGDTKDVWYSFTPLISGVHAFDTLGTVGMDTVLAIFDVCDGTQLACDDDGGGFPLSRVQAALTQGITYYVRVAGYGGAEGNFTLNSVQPSPPPTNDTCDTAEAVTLPYSYSQDISGAGEDLDVSCNDPNAVSSANGVWFSYTPATTQLVRFQETSTANTVISIFTGGCASPFEDYCSDPEDFIRTLQAGTEYRILLSAYSVTGVPLGTPVQFAMTEVQAPTNDTCSTATVVSAVPFSDTVDTSTASNDVDVACNATDATETRYGVWYSFTPDHNGLYAFGETSTNDVVLALFSGPCDSPSEVTCSNAETMPPQNLSAGVTVYILVGMWSNITVPTTPITFTVSEVFAPTNDGCADARVITTTPYLESVDPSTATSDYDVSCNDANAVETSYGVWYTYTTGVDGGTFRLNETGPNNVVMGVFTGADCNNLSEVFCTDAEGNVAFSANPSTQYWILVGMWSSTAAPTGTYNFAFNIDLPLGACCTASGCTLTTVSQCTGTHQGIGTTCGGTTGYNVASSTDAFEDISATGTPLATVSGCDDCGEVANLGFTFNFLGTDYTDVWVVSNGYLQFPGTGGPHSTVYVNAPIPDPALPNGIVAPFWDDLNTLTAGDVYLLVDGTAPNRRAVISWQNVSQFANTDSNSFQVILHEGSNDIEFRYGSITAETPAGDYSVGYESVDGFTGSSIPGANLGGGGVAYEWSNANPCGGGGETGACCSAAACSVVASGACTGPGTRFVGSNTACNAQGDFNSPCCRSDTNQDGTVSLQDLFDYLTLWFSQAPGADSNGNGSVSVQDLFDFLTSWFTHCQ